ncbi:MAG: CoA transferase subunit A [Myxococcales bacterium]|nr:CoA transferase subunit A [Myxococcales bacterium]
MKKVYENATAALHDVRDGISLMSGGFGLCGNAENCIAELVRSGIRDLTVVSNNCGNAGKGLAALLQHRQVKKVIASFIGGNPDVQSQMLSGEIEVELNPQGTLAERIRAGGAGIGGFFTPTGVGTVVANGKEERIINGKRMILEAPLTADYAIIRARVGDPFGNLRFYKTARNFSPLMAMASRICVVEVEELVSLGDLGPDDIHLPGLYVQRLFVGKGYEDPIEKLTVRPREV